MRIVLQRVSQASVTIDGRVAGSIGPGLLLLLGVAPGDTEADGAWLASKVARLRIFPDEAGLMNRSVADTGGGVLVVSQFTLYGDAAKGRRPSWSAAAPAAVAEPIFDHFCAHLRDLGAEAETGRFGAHMQVSLVNEGPCTIIIDTDEWKKKE